MPETTEATSAEAVNEGTQGNTTTGDELITESIMPDKDSSPKPPDNSDPPTTTENKDHTTSPTEPPANPTNDTAAAPDNDGDDMLGYGVELPDDNWD